MLVVILIKPLDRSRFLNYCDILNSGCATQGRARANSLAELPPPSLTPRQSRVVIIKLLYIQIFWLPLLMRLMTCLFPAKGGGPAPPLISRSWSWDQRFWSWCSEYWQWSWGFRLCWHAAGSKVWWSCGSKTFAHNYKARPTVPHNCDISQTVQFDLSIPDWSLASSRRPNHIHPVVCFQSFSFPSETHLSSSLLWSSWRPNFVLCLAGLPVDNLFGMQWWQVF